MEAPNKNRKQQKRSSLDLGTMVFGKVPPQAKDIEEAVLGAVMIQKDSFTEISQMLKPECFYVEAHQRIFRAMLALESKSQPIDMLTVAEQLRSQDELELVGGPYYVTKLTNSVVSSAHNQHYCRIILQKFLKREVIRIGGLMIGDAYEDSVDVFDLMNDFEKEYTQLSLGRLGKQIAGLDVHLVQRLQRIEKLRQNPQHITGIASGFGGIDNITHGWQNTDLIILAARPAVGKTALAMNMARNAAMNPEKPVPVAFFSLEMSAGQLVDRIISAESEIWLDKIMNGYVDDHQMKVLFTKGVGPLGKGAKIYIDETPALNLFELRTRCRMLRRQWLKELGTEDGLIIIDYLQLMSGMSENYRNNNREQEISQISRGLKSLAKELNVPIIALSQLNRATENRKGEAQTPKLSDLRESGAIEQDADMVMFMYRPEYYEIKADELGENTKGLTLISIAKHRNGKLAQGNEAIRLKANLAIQKFTDWNDSPVDVYKAVLPSGAWRPIEQDDTKDLFS